MRKLANVIFNSSFFFYHTSPIIGSAPTILDRYHIITEVPKKCICILLILPKALSDS